MSFNSGEFNSAIKCALVYIIYKVFSIYIHAYLEQYIHTHNVPMTAAARVKAEEE